MWPTCDELWASAATGRINPSMDREDRERLNADENTIGITALAEAGNGDLDYRITNEHINRWRGWAEKEVQQAIERSAELVKMLKEFDRTHPI